MYPCKEYSARPTSASKLWVCFWELYAVWEELKQFLAQSHATIWTWPQWWQENIRSTQKSFVAPNNAWEQGVRQGPIQRLMVLCSSHREERQWPHSEMPWPWSLTSTVLRIAGLQFKKNSAFSKLHCKNVEFASYGGVAFWHAKQ